LQGLLLLFCFAGLQHSLISASERLIGGESRTLRAGKKINTGDAY